MDSAMVGWGISTAGWLISPVISKLLSRCFSYLGFCSSDKLEKLESKILEVKLMLESAETSPQKERLEEGMKDLKPRMEQWMKVFKSAFYEAEDILDAIEYHEIESRILHQNMARTKQDAEFMMDFNIPMESRKELKEILNKLEDLIDEGHKLLSWVNLPASSENMNNAPKHTLTSPNSTTSAPPVVFGRDWDLKMIREMLRDTPADSEPSSSRTKCYSVIAIHGIPGSGKTTLAQYVCEHEKEDGYFNIVLWIHVSKNFSVDTVFAEMLEIAPGRKRDLICNLDSLKGELESKLRDKRFLLVLDDVWYDKDATEEQLNLLLSPLKVGRMGSRILMTTRTVDAARALGAQNLVAISDLDKEQFFSMFMHYALDGATISDQALVKEYQSTGRKIAEKLGRSPLAARTVAGQLKIRLDFDFWISAMKSDLLNNGTAGALWWSYQQLAEHVKQCFAFCSIFPRRYELQEDELVHLWMAEGFVKTSNAIEDMEDVCRGYFHVLLSTSFIQLKGEKYGKQYFTIHDLLHDIAGQVAGSDCFIIENSMVGQIPQDVRHLFIVSYDERVFREQILNLKFLRTIIMSSSFNRSMLAEDFRSMLKRLEKLRVVHVEINSLSTISPCIGRQKHLRYLGIFGRIVILTLPRQFTKLYQLQKFAVRPTTLVDYHFDEEIADLVNLRYMICRVFDCPDIRRLTLLRSLSVFRVRNRRGHEIEQLEHLDNLHGTLSIQGLENVKSKEEAHQAKLANKVHISDLVLQWNTITQSSSLMLENQDDRKSKESHSTSNQELAEGRTGDQSSYPQEEVLEALRPPLLITSLKIMNYGGSTYPSWFVGEQGALENLKHLELSCCYAPPKIGKSCMYLRTLVISGCRWCSLPENVEYLIWLEKLIIDECENILSLPRLPPSLKELMLRHWSGSSLPDDMECLTSLEKFSLGLCYNILSLPRLPQSLKKLQIMYCNRSLIESCLTDGHPNYQNIAHIKEKHIC